MRPLVLVVMIATLRLCGSEDAPPAPPTAAVGVEGSAGIAGPPVPAPAHGGAVTLVGRHRVEVVARADRAVVGYVTDATGGTPPPAGLTLTVEVHGADGAPHAVPLAWSPAHLRFEGTLGVAPAPGPVVVTLVDRGTPVVATIALVTPVVAVVSPDEHVDVRVHGHDDDGLAGAPAGVVVIGAPPPVRVGVYGVVEEGVVVREHGHHHDHYEVYEGGERIDVHVHGGHGHGHWH